jgi:uncharacterized protein YqeY
LLSAHIDEYDRNLNGISAQDLINKFAQTRRDNVDAEKNEIELTKANKGKLMKIIMPMAKGGYDAAVVNKVIGGLLQ